MSAFDLSSPFFTPAEFAITAPLPRQFYAALPQIRADTRPIQSARRQIRNPAATASCVYPPISSSPPPPPASSPLPLLQTAASLALDALEHHFLAHIERLHPFPPSSDPTLQLAGNFSPVPEHPVQLHLDVDGRVPTDLDGVYVRNGANPMFTPVAGHHLFDGDGMLHAIAFSGGQALSYANRFTRTHRLQEEIRIGRAIFPKAIGELHGHTGIARLLLFYVRSLFGILDSHHGLGAANAGVLYFNNKLLAMSEDDLPYAVHITPSHDLHTLGRYDFNGQLSSSMIAHPKLDSHTGELFALSYDVFKKPYLKYFKFSKDGHKGPDVAITDVEHPTMMHDFAITENYAVIPDQQVVFKLQEMLRGGSPLVHDKSKTPRFGILPRNAINDHDIKWVDVPDCFCFHLWNAWEEGDEVVVIGSCMTPPDSIFNDCDVSLKTILSMIRLNLKTLTSIRQPITESYNLEAGQINRKLIGRKTRFAYLAITDPWPKVSGIAKVKLQPLNPPIENPDKNTMCNNSTNTNIVGTFMYPPNCFGGEPMFVPRLSSDASILELEEDDGYVLTFMHNEGTNKSELLILDAKSPTLNLIASIKLPSRVPYGFHGTFITTRELKHQNASTLDFTNFG